MVPHGLAAGNFRSLAVAMPRCRPQTAGEALRATNDARHERGVESLAMRETVSRSEAAFLLGIDEPRVAHYVATGDLSPDRSDRFELTQVMAFRTRREADQKAATNEILSLSSSNN